MCLEDRGELGNVDEPEEVDVLLVQPLLILLLGVHDLHLLLGDGHPPGEVKYESLIYFLLYKGNLIRILLGGH